ncbi:hypothetical protein B0T14DRAFT_567509 [Immersiella caudata]|uniref:Uncharacterized protein n=1 Tax=Immersiella caudata TaxID=314043 RepID=A0AA40C169_9PEZI|nr:hypothetical protein B0T14DRAFT_567509 [Immersiella caudata]
MNMRLPKVREKLSSLVRRGSSKNKKTATTGQHVGTVAPVLEVDLKQVESFRLAEGWLEDASSPPSPKKRSARGGRGGDGANEPGRRNPEARYSATPIADLFSMSTDQLASTLQTITRKPVPPPAPRPAVSGPWSVAPPPSTAPTVDIAPAARVTKRNASAEAAVTEEPQPIRISLRHSVVEPVVAPTPEVKSTRRRAVMSWSNATSPDLSTPSAADAAAQASSQRHAVREISLLRSVGPNTTGLRVTTGGGATVGNGSSGSGSGSIGTNASVENTKRHSTTSIPSPVALQLADRMPIPEAKPILATPDNLSLPTPKSSTSDLRRRSWQPAAALPQAPTSVPSPVTAAPGSMAPPLRRTPSNRPPSAALTSGRLAWIRELENKSSSSSGASKPELQKLKAPGGGGVAGKLAMFEHMQKKQPGPISLSRSNSTTSSRVSSGAMADSLFAGASSTLSLAGDAPPSTARTSIDSTRSIYASHRNSAVLAYYDEEFREKMEGVAGGFTKQLGLDKKGEEVDQTASGLRKVTAQLVEVAKVKTVPEEPQVTKGSASSENAGVETVEEEKPEIKAEEQSEPKVEEKVEEKPAEVSAPVETSPSSDAEPAKVEVAQAQEAPAPEEPSSALLEVEEPAKVAADAPEPAKVEAPEIQTSQVSGAPAEPVVPTAPAVATEAKTETVAPQTPESKQPVIAVGEIAQVSAQEPEVNVAEQKLVEIQVVPEEKSTLGSSEVAAEEVVGAVAEPAVKLQEPTPSS